MRRTLILACGFALTVSSALAAQTVRWNDQPAKKWSDEAPRVILNIEGSRSLPPGSPVRVRFEVSDNAFVTVVRVDDDGRMTILFPYSRTQRAAVRGGQVNYVRNPRLGGEFAFRVTGGMGGYIFALASYAPLDFTNFENRDYDRMGGFSRFTQVNRSNARRPDVFIDRFAAAVLWDTDTPYDYDVDYYFPTGNMGRANAAYAMCASSYMGVGLSPYGQPWEWYDWDLVGYPYRSLCRDWYTGIQCYTYLALFSAVGCAARAPTVTWNGPVTVPGQPGDSTVVPNEGVVRGGMFGPTPVPLMPPDSSPPPAERPVGRFDQVRPGEPGDLDNIMSIPARATKKMKDDDARRERGSAEPASRTFDRVEATGKDKSSTADASSRVQPPSREPTKAKGTSEPRRETAKTGYGSSNTGTSQPRPSNPDHVTRPSEPKSAGPSSSSNPPSIQGTTTEKKKPPQNN